MNPGQLKKKTPKQSRVIIWLTELDFFLLFPVLNRQGISKGLNLYTIWMRNETKSKNN